MEIALSSCEARLEPPGSGVSFSTERYTVRAYGRGCVLQSPLPGTSQVPGRRGGSVVAGVAQPWALRCSCDVRCSARGTPGARGRGGTHAETATHGSQYSACAASLSGLPRVAVVCHPGREQVNGVWVLGVGDVA